MVCYYNNLLNINYTISEKTNTKKNKKTLKHTTNITKRIENEFKVKNNRLTKTHYLKNGKQNRREGMVGYGSN